MTIVEKSITLVSSAIPSQMDVATIKIKWSFEFLWGRAGAYKASPIILHASFKDTKKIKSVKARLVERSIGSGTITKCEEFLLERKGQGFVGELHWESTVNTPEQELTISFMSVSADEPETFLRDPISRRYNFLISLSK